MTRSNEGRRSGPGITRREFLKGSSAASAFVATGGIGALLAGCGGADDGAAGGGSTTAARPPSDAPAAPGVASAPASETIYEQVYPTLERGGELTVGYSGQVPASLDVLTDVSGSVAWAADPAHDWLEHYDHEARLVTSLAERLEIQDDTTLRYTLRDAKFHNGRQVSAQDVKDTFDYVTDPKTGSFLASRLEGVSVEIEDDTTAVLRLERPDAAIRAQLPALPIIPVEDAAKQASEPVGCGPFVFEEWVRDSYVQYTRNPDYWNPEAPLLDRLRINHYPDEDSGAQAFLAGQVAYAVQAPLAQLPDYQARADQDELAIDVINSGWLYIGMNHEVEPYDNPLVRKAISLALDRPAMAQAPFSNLAAPQWFGGIAPNHPWYPADLEFARDVERARSLLTEAGYANGFSDVMLTLGDKDYFVGINTIAQANLAEIGVTIDLEVVDIATLLERTFTNKDYTICSLGDAIHPEPAAQLDVYFSSSGGNNYFNYSNDEADSLMRRARETFDEAERAQLYRQVFELLFIEDIAAIPVTTEPGLGIYSGTNVDQWGPDPIARFHYPIAGATG